jgi:hypothetical protein
MESLLDEPQIVLLCELVEAVRRVPSGRDEEFIAFQALGDDRRIPVRHSGFPGDHYYAHQQDIVILEHAGLITMNKKDQNLAIFFIHPKGFKHYEHVKRTMGAPLERAEVEVRRLLVSDHFKSAYDDAYTKWAKAEALLWGADSADQLSAIGHHCREAMQDFATTLVDRYKPTGANTNPMNTVARIRAALEVAGIVGSTERAFLDAIVAYWGSVSDLVQRQEHAGQKEGRAVTWQDARRVVLQTMLVMYEVSLSIVTSRQRI